MKIYDYAVLPYHFAQAALAGMFYGFPGRRLKIIGVTGTNGKTTTCFMIWKMLNSAGYKTGLMTTVAWGGVGGNEKDLEEQQQHMTTATPGILNERIKAIADSGAEYLVLELTSHALTQYRDLGIPIEVAVFTNLTHEHLDYHKTMENYRAAKGKLFEKAKFSIINADDENVKWFKEHSKKYTTYGIKNGEKRAKNVKMTKKGVFYECGDIKIQSKLAGIFNVYNSLAAVCVGEKLGLNKAEIERGILALEGVEGRMSRFELGQDYTAIIDYAHTPDAFEKLLPDIKGSTKGRLIVVFGSAGGRRDPSKREPQGELAGKYADVVILTEEDDRDTPGMEILEQIAVGVRKFGKKDGENLFFELDRPTAILKACQMARKGDTVLFLGKGHEKTIERKDGEHPYYEPEVIEKAIKKVLKAK